MFQYIFRYLIARNDMDCYLKTLHFFIIWFRIKFREEPICGLSSYKTTLICTFFSSHFLGEIALFPFLVLGILACIKLDIRLYLHVSTNMRNKNIMSRHHICGNVNNNTSMMKWLIYLCKDETVIKLRSALLTIKY